jgi:hypothetical protein
MQQPCLVVRLSTRAHTPPQHTTTILQKQQHDAHNSLSLICLTASEPSTHSQHALIHCVCHPAGRCGHSERSRSGTADCCDARVTVRRCAVLLLQCRRYHAAAPHGTDNDVYEFHVAVTSTCWITDTWRLFLGCCRCLRRSCPPSTTPT